MNLLIINTSEKIGGAAIAARRLMEALRNSGINVKMLVRDRQTNHPAVTALPKSWLNIVRFVWERLVIWGANKFKKNDLFAVDIANTGTDITRLPEFKKADIIHLHWINQGMLSLHDIEKIIASGKPVVWTMHDMWAFTGICHYSGNCSRYTHDCHHCPMLYGGGYRHDLSHRTFHRKQSLLRGAEVTFVACSRWLESMAKQSTLLQGKTVTNIPNAINTQLYHPLDKRIARERCNLPQEKKLLLFGSVKINDKRKGFDYLIQACYILCNQFPTLRERLGVVVVGKHGGEIGELIPFPVYSMDYVSDEKRLVDIYNAADLYVTPSLQDNLPNTIVEAMACGVPCIGFNVGGIPQMIDHLHNGYIAEYCNAADFANGIQWALGEDYDDLSEAARRKAEESYSEKTIAKRYIEIYNKLLTK